MKIDNIIVHSIKKTQASKSEKSPRASVNYSPHEFPATNATVESFGTKLAKSYFDKKSRFSTVFTIGENKPKFQERLDEQLVNTLNFYDFSKKITELLKDEMEKEALSSGGYLVIMKYTSSNNYKYLFVALLNNKEDFSITNTLELTKSLSLNIDKMAMASVINISKYENANENYLTFLKGLRDIPDYFIYFIGADKDKKKDLREQTQNWVKAIDSYFNEQEVELDIRQTMIKSILDTVKESKKKEELITSDTIANIIEPSNPELFIEYVYAEDRDFNINPEMETLDSEVVRKLNIIKYENKQKGFVFKLKKEFKDATITIENDKITIIDQEIVNGIKAEFDS